MHGGSKGAISVSMGRENLSSQFDNHLRVRQDDKVDKNLLLQLSMGARAVNARTKARDYKQSDISINLKSDEVGGGALSLTQNSIL